MGRIVLKVDRDRDLYVEWSGIVESLTFIGSRSEMLAYLHRDAPDGYTPGSGNSPENRLRRADQTGTSALYPADPPYYGAWDDTGFIVEQRGCLPRGDLGRFVDLVLADDMTAAYRVLRALE